MVAREIPCGALGSWVGFVLGGGDGSTGEAHWPSVVSERRMDLGRPRVRSPVHRTSESLPLRVEIGLGPTGAKGEEWTGWVGEVEAGVGKAPYPRGATAGPKLNPLLLVGGPGHADMPLAAGLGTR